jgi:hypothetical protein
MFVYIFEVIQAVFLFMTHQPNDQITYAAFVLIGVYCVFASTSTFKLACLIMIIYQIAYHLPAANVC